MTSTAPYGAWTSPITAADVARSGVRLRFPRLVGEGGQQVWWLEGRPEQGGRQAVVRQLADGSVHDVLPAPWNARTRVHEYGGQSFLAVPHGRSGEHALVFTEFTDQRLYRLDPDSAEPVPLTPAPRQPAGLRYADPVADPSGRSVWCVRESHESDGMVRRHLVTVPLDGSGEVTEVVSGSDFLAWPRPSADGRLLAWVAWDHPRMPWDGTELRVGQIGPEGTVDRWRTLLGGPTESVLQPEWARTDTLYAASDRSGWWNLYRIGLAGGEPEPLCPRPEEFGSPLWQLGFASYAVLDDGRLAVLHGVGGHALGLLDPSTGALNDLDLPYTNWGATLDTRGAAAVAIAASPVRAPEVLRIDLATGAASTVRSSMPDTPDPAYLSLPSSQRLPGPDGRDVHAHVYPPTNPDLRGPAGESPPYLVFVHGGPTANAGVALDLEKAYFTSRGIGVIDVNYGGSSGYGRAYRERLREQWGIVDVQDSVAAVRALVERGDADGARLAIRGGSAGGWTVLAALTGTDAFGAGTSYYGVAELVRFAEDTHDFESRYLDGLIGPLPQCRDRYVARAPLSHVDELSCPVLLLQGAEDQVVPPSQAEMFRDALARKGIRHAYLLFDGEQHGFRRAETQITCLHAELSFYGQVFGFDPPGVPRLELTTGRRPG
ncbi:MAG TPA: prolyl oligopeptidase family serine peptidase [Mycobacteriales bacterium]|nr:prolyl oligopeptidase family serine peptidase [Mycobacteriales bacterium]